MSNQDFFREIAMTKHPIANTDKEVIPLPIPDRYFHAVEKKEKTGSIFKGESSFEEKTAEYYQELKRLKKRYQPFMENHLPKQEATVQIKEFKEFEFRYLLTGERFTERSEKKDWEPVTVPDYRGPADEHGKWRCYYKTMFTVQDEIDCRHRYILRFQCVDYRALVYVNGNFAGEHEGFFAPFEMDVTDYLDYGFGKTQELIIECRNDYTILGTGPVLDGDKIYAATGPGWDDPETGWHHCPAGAGVFGRVTLEYRPLLHIDDIFVRSDIDHDAVELRIGIMNYGREVETDYQLAVSLLPKNIHSGLDRLTEEIGALAAKVPFIGIGKNEYRYQIPIHDYRLWECDTPYLYGALASLTKEEEPVSSRTGTFGIKKFEQDVSDTAPDHRKGRFFMNNKPIVLRGANEMGHLQQCVMKGDFDLLVEDILIAKMCSLNYYRVTQRPVQEEIYDYFDMLGIMHQCDLPLFAFLRRNQFAEAVKQTVEMEHLIRSHVSSVMVTFINEPMCIRRTADPGDKFSKRYDAKGHRHLLRDELEAFFSAARKAVYVENPDRVIKNVEGDYDAPTAEGMPDFHTYTMWYTNHGEPIGRLMKGYMPPVKEGWMIGCGEYGAEGLDNTDIIRERYPKEWLTEDEHGHWYPDRIVRAQSHSVQGDWFEEQNTMEDWVRESQIHQANATRLMTDAFRRRGDVINQTAIHLLIDAWPSGWMKTLVCCDRAPKRAYFAYQESLVPLRINLFTDRWYVYEGEHIGVETWLLNDTAKAQELTIKAELTNAKTNELYECYEGKGCVGAATAICSGLLPVTLPSVKKATAIRLTAIISDAFGTALNQESILITCYPKTKARQKVTAVGDAARQMLSELDIKESKDADVLLCSDVSEEGMKLFSDAVASGKKGILLLDKQLSVRADGCLLETKPCQAVFYGGTKTKDYPLFMMYNKEKGYIDFTGQWIISSDRESEILAFTYDKKGFNGSIGPKNKLPFAARYQGDHAEFTAISISWQNKLCCNPNLDYFLLSLILE